MGLHRADTYESLGAVEIETRKRVFWTLRCLEASVSAFLGLPRSLSDEDVDQVLPDEINDECFPQRVTISAQNGRLPAIVVSNKYTRLMLILARIMKDTYSNKNNTGGIELSRQIDVTRIRGIERDLAQWLQNMRISYENGNDTLITRFVLHCSYMFGHNLKV
jgi:hypothetical protein